MRRLYGARIEAIAPIAQVRFLEHIAYALSGRRSPTLWPRKLERSTIASEMYHELERSTIAVVMEPSAAHQNSIVLLFQ